MDRRSFLATLSGGIVAAVVPGCPPEAATATTTVTPRPSKPRVYLNRDLEPIPAEEFYSSSAWPDGETLAYRARSITYPHPGINVVGF